MAATVAEHPRWVGAMLVCAVLGALSVAVLPYELFEEMQRRMMIEGGGPPTPIPEDARLYIRIFSIVGAALSIVIFSFIGAGITTFIFAFVLGDEGRYRQYLAVGVHTAMVPLVVATLLAPMRVASGDPQLTINVGTFMTFLPDGYLYNVFRAMDVSQIWAMLVAAQGIHAIDRKNRSFASAATIQLGIFLCIALVVGWLFTQQGL
jgi:hypothetical protein